MVRCSRCERPVAATNIRVCDDCQERSDATRGARDEWPTGAPGERLELGDSVTLDGSVLRFEFLRSFETAFAIRYLVDGPVAWVVGDGRSQTDPKVNGPWDAHDDAGNVYRGIGQAFRASSAFCRGEVWFAPTLANPAKVLTIHALNNGESLLSATVKLGARTPLQIDAQRPGLSPL